MLHPRKTDQTVLSLEDWCDVENMPKCKKQKTKKTKTCWGFLDILNLYGV